MDVESLIEDGRSMSDDLQGVTLGVMGEGTSSRRSRSSPGGADDDVPLVLARSRLT